MPSACWRWPPVGSGLGAIEDADVVQAEEAAGEEVVAFEVLAVDPPGEIDDQLLEAAGQEYAVAVAAAGGHLVNAPAGPGMDGRVDVGEVELVGRQLAVGVHVPLAQEEHELLFGVIGVNLGKGDHVEGQVPGGVPRVFPFVGHGDDVAVVEVEPVGVAARGAGGRGRRLLRVALQPIPDDVMIELLVPEQPGVGLAHDAGLVFAQPPGQALGVELVGLANPVAGTPDRMPGSASGAGVSPASLGASAALPGLRAGCPPGRRDACPTI